MEPIREPGAASCPNTGITIPECSCHRCLEDQVRRHMPELLLREARPLTPTERGVPPPERRTPRAA